MLVKDLLNERESQHISINAGSSVEAAVGMMSAYGAAAVVVMEDDQPAGIFTEGDLLRCHLANPCRAFSDIDIVDAMTRQFIAVRPDEDIRQALDTMINARIRHLPVVQGGRIAGILTIHALIKRQMELLSAEIQYLQDYINDLHDAELD